MSLSVAFRVDATIQIGTGHFMRCLALADQLKKNGAQVCFVSRGLLSHLRDMVLARDMKFYALKILNEMENSDTLSHSHWLQCSQVQDALDCSGVLASCRLDWIVVDHYALDQHWETAMRKITKKIMVIDDLADRKHDCDVLLDQNFYVDMQTRYSDKVPSHCQMLLGPKYALLREEFKLIREKTKPRNGEIKKVLVFLGGVDADNYTSLVIQTLFEIDRLLHVDVVIGIQHPFRAQIQNICREYGFTCHVQTSQMAALMAQADLAIGAGGTATWERCCLGLPALSICIAENQRRQVIDAAEIGLLYSALGGLDLAATIRDQVRALLCNPSLIKMVSKISMKAVDGMGILRISNVLHDIQKDLDNIVLRKAGSDDAIKFWPWRNHEDTRRFFFDKSEVNLDEHVEWWKKSLLNSNRILLIGTVEEVDFGVIRFDFEGPEKVITSIYISPLIKGKGLGRALLISGLKWLGKYHKNVKLVLADIIPENVASISLFKSAGFAESHLVFRLEMPVNGH